MIFGEPMNFSHDHSVMVILWQRLAGSLETSGTWQAPCDFVHALTIDLIYSDICPFIFLSSSFYHSLFLALSFPFFHSSSSNCLFIFFWKRLSELNSKYWAMVKMNPDVIPSSEKNEVTQSNSGLVIAGENGASGRPETASVQGDLDRRVSEKKQWWGNIDASIIRCFENNNESLSASWEMDQIQ